MLSWAGLGSGLGLVWTAPELTVLLGKRREREERNLPTQAKQTYTTSRAALLLMLWCMIKIWYWSIKGNSVFIYISLFNRHKTFLVYFHFILNKYLLMMSAGDGMRWWWVILCNAELWAELRSGSGLDWTGLLVHCVGRVERDTPQTNQCGENMMVCVSIVSFLSDII